MIAAAIVACVPAGVGASNVIGAVGGEASSAGGPLTVGSLAGVPGSDTIEGITRDPKGTGQDWAVSVFRAQNGQTCVAQGRKVGNKVGDVGRDGRFTPYPIADGASCVDLSTEPAGVSVTGDSGMGRTTVYGVVGPKVRAVSITAAGVTEDVPPGPRGAFLRVFGPEVEPPTPGSSRSGVSVTVTLKDGTIVPLLG